MPCTLCKSEQVCVSRQEFVFWRHAWQVELLSHLWTELPSGDLRIYACINRSTIRSAIFVYTFTET
jgi:hypothetical protein